MLCIITSLQKIRYEIFQMRYSITEEGQEIEEKKKRRRWNRGGVGDIEKRKKRRYRI